MNEILVRIKRKDIEQGNAESILSYLRNFLKKEDDQNLIQAKSKFNEYLKRQNLSLTQERYLILEKTFDAEKTFTVDDVHILAMKDIVICRRTIAYSIELLVSAGIIKEITGTKERFQKKYYEII